MKRRPVSSLVLVVAILSFATVQSAAFGMATFLRGEVNGDGGIDMSDAVFVLQWLFGKGRTPTCMDAADANDDGVLDLSDGVAILQWRFGGGAPLPGPLNNCGHDPTADELECESHGACEEPNNPDRYEKGSLEILDPDGKGVIPCNLVEDSGTQERFLHCETQNMVITQGEKIWDVWTVSINPRTSAPCCAASLPCCSSGDPDCPCELFELMEAKGAYADLPRGATSW